MPPGETTSKNSPWRSAWTSSERTPAGSRLRRKGRSATLSLAPIRANFVSRSVVSIVVPPWDGGHEPFGPGSLPEQESASFDRASTLVAADDDPPDLLQRLQGRLHPAQLL